MEQRIARMRASASVSDAFMVATLLDGRHPGMIAYIERVAAERPLNLVAVGALHFFGPNGLIAMLRGRGWSIASLD
jgi:uncharacterized protein YbaP (TraB family)